MRFVGTAWAAMVSTLAGCSLLYNPNNLPQPKLDAGGPETDVGIPIDALIMADAPPPDMPTDTNLANPVVTEIGPKVLFEGQGTGGSRRAILAIVGGNFGPDATVAIDPTSAPDPTILIDIDNANIVRSPSGTALAVPITLPVDPAHGSPTAKDVPLTITVMQTGASPLATSGKVLLRNLPELTTPITSMSSPPVLYSQVKVVTPISFAASTTAAPAVIRAIGSIELNDVHADASGGTPGPGGGVGGNTTPGNGGGAGGGKAAVLLTIGSTASGGGFGTAGAPGTGLAPVAGGVASGDNLISAFATNGSGGGGGGGSVGGGGGGQLEITAGGTLTIGKVSANGASPGGGGGSGGAIVLRAGALAKLNGDITAAGGGGSGIASGGIGRLRFDVPARMGSPAMTAVTHVGASFDIATDANPLVTTDSHPLLHLLGESSSAVWTMSVVNAQGSTTSSQTFTFGSSSATVTPALSSGYNRICVSPPTGDPSILESSNCIDLAYVP